MAELRAAPARGEAPIGNGLTSLLYRIGALLRRREVDVWYDPAFRLPLPGLELTGMDPRRADLAAWRLRQARTIAPRWWRAPRRATWAELARVHSEEMLASLGQPGRLAHIFAIDPSDIPVDEVMRTVRLATGATIQAAGEALRRRTPQLCLLGGFHHAGPTAAGGNCPVNDIAAAVASVRADGFDGRVVVIDLDAHPPDGVAACLAGDRSAWIGSLSGSDWGPMPGVDETVLPEGTGDEPYLAALQGLLSRMPPPELAFVIAGGDVVAGDRMGKLGLTMRGVRRRDLAVAARLRGIPSVWLPGGGYGQHAWKVLAGTGMVLSLASLREISEDADPMASRFARIAAQMPRGALSDDGELTEQDIAEALGMKRAQKLLLGFYTASGLEHALQRYGVFDHLRRMGYENFRVAFDPANPGDRLRLTGESDGQEQLLIELVLERKRVGGYPMLYVHWLSLRHPRAQFSDRRPALPGQEVPGLGLAREVGELLALMALRLDLAGVAFRPAHYHTAFTARHNFSFADPARQGRFEALMRDLSHLPLAEATEAVDAGRVRLDGTPYRWEPDEMVMWLGEPPEEPGEVALARDQARFEVT